MGSHRCYVTPVFVTWRLYGSLPRTSETVAARIQSGRQFVAWDRLLDAARNGPVWLRDAAIADIIQGVLRTEAAVMGRFQLHAWVIMANHVHVLLTPRLTVADVARHVKGRSGRLANQALGRKGQPFWQDEGFVRPIVGAAEFRRVVHYIEVNPVKAGLVSSPAEYFWSSAGQELGPQHCLGVLAAPRSA